MLVEGHVWWGHRWAKAEETTVTTGVKTPWEVDPIAGVTSTEEGGVEVESQVLEAEAVEGQEEDTTTWMVCGSLAIDNGLVFRVSGIDLKDR